jgi:hypothetical protein
MLKKLLGINWKTTLPGILVIFGVIAKILAAWRTKDIATLLTSTQELIPDLIAVLAGIGLITAKASDVTGAGTQAKAVDSTGEVTNIEGQKVGQQSSIPPQPKLNTPPQ